MARRAVLLAAACAAAAWQCACAQLPAPTPPPLQPFSLAGVVAAQRTFAAGVPVTPSGLSSSSYLDTIAQVLPFWLQYQAANGSVLDPMTQQEEEYGTPCFAWAAAALVAHAGRTDLLPNASAALNVSISQMASRDAPPGGGGACPQATCDFFALPVMLAYKYLAPLVAPATAAAWTAALQGLTISTFTLPGQNWELTAAAGEWIRMRQLGWETPAFNWSLWESRLQRLATVEGASGFWSPDGLFDDNAGQLKSSPTAYDAFGSTYGIALLQEGYGTTNDTAPLGGWLSEMSRRGVWSRAAFQSPLGEQAVGGRSNQHQFAEATLAAAAEYQGSRAAAEGDVQGACMLRRAARQYHTSVRRWIRSDLDTQRPWLAITKNYFPYPLRFGYMGYSFLVNYNLLPLAWLATAHEWAAPDSAFGECATPADVGGAVVVLPDSQTRKVYASVRGTYIEIMTGADPEYDAAGMNRLHIDFCAIANASDPAPCRLPSLLGPSQAPGLLDSAAAPGGLALSTGIFWRLASDAPSVRRTLANNTLQTILGALVTPGTGNSPATGVGFTLQYVLWGEGALVTESYSLSPSGGLVNVTAGVSLPGDDALLSILADGAHAAQACRAAAAARNDVAATAVCPSYIPPADAAAAAAIASRDVAALRAATGVLAARPGTAGSTGAVFSAFGVQWPAIVFDGRTNYTLQMAPPANSAVLGLPRGSPFATPQDGAVEFAVAPPPGRNLTWTFDSASWAPSRNGILSPVYAELDTVNSAAPQLSYSLRLVPALQ